MRRPRLRRWLLRRLTLRALAGAAFAAWLEGKS